MLILAWKRPLVKTRIYHGPSINRMQTAVDARLYNILSGSDVGVPRLAINLKFTEGYFLRRLSLARFLN